MIHFFIGTKAQLIKMAPIMIGLREKNIPFRYIDSGQHAAITTTLRQQFNLPEPDFSLRHNTQDITSIRQAAIWYSRQWLNIYSNKAYICNQVFPEGGICLVHGDTLSTLLGLQMAKAAGLKIAHVEAGLRSYKLFDPFPEELIRIYCMRRADLLFAPSDTAFANLKKMKLKGQCINIGANTVVDTLHLLDQSVVSSSDAPFALVTCHRLETLTRKTRLSKVVSLINRVAEELDVVFVMHKPTKRYLERFKLLNQLSSRVNYQDMLDYAQFITLLMHAKLVLTDGGSIQEECAALSKPCLILRNVTERSDGLGKNARLWRFDDEAVDKVMTELNHYNKSGTSITESPSEHIIHTLIKQGFI